MEKRLFSPILFESIKMINQNKLFTGQAGNVMVEYVVVTLILTMFLFAPITEDHQSIMGLLMEAIRDFDRNRSILYSLP
jgi:hypothetical protein